MGEPAAALSIELPEKSADLTQWAAETARRLDAATRCPPETLPQVLSAETCCQLLERCQKVLHLEPTLLEVTPPAEGQVVVVGDTHGQFHDVCRMLELVGSPSTSNIIVFNGDFVDRGAWGLETLLLLVAWKLALPRHFFLLRGNHESATCTMCYGFKGELVAKYGKSHWRPVYAACKRLFSSLPVSAKVGQHTLVLHGGLFRRQPQRGVGKNKRKRAHPLLYGLDDVTLGTLEDLARATKGGMDPNGLGTSRLASDVLWSDPVGDPGFSPNLTRGVGMCFGPDVTERFLTENGLRLVLRSHEGPDAREGREDMQPMSAGYTLDHDTPAGKLMTVFSAPDYPQFIAEETDRYNNLAAVAVLTAPNWDTPAMRQYAAAHPRPEARPYYDLWVPDSDEEFEPAASDASGMTDVERPNASLVSTASEAGTVQQEGDAEQQQQQEGHSAEQQQAVPGIGTREKADSLLAGSAAAADVEATAAATAATAAAAAAAAAAQETSNRSEETAVADLGDGVSCALVQPVQLPAAFAAKASQHAHKQQHQRSPKRTRGAAAAGSTVAAA